MEAPSQSHKRLVLSDQFLELVAGRFKALSESIRLKLILALEEGELNVTDLVAATGMKQANISRHLQQLARAGILSRRKAGSAAYYRINDPAIFELCEHVCGSLKEQIKREAGVAGLLSGID